MQHSLPASLPVGLQVPWQGETNPWQVGVRCEQERRLPMPPNPCALTSGCLCTTSSTSQARPVRLPQIASAVLAGQRPQLPDRDQLPGGGGAFPGLDSYLALMEACWAQDPASRPDFQGVVTRLR